jgi:O-antigen ligase
MQHDQGFVLPDLKFGGGYGQFINKNHLAFLIEPAIGLLLGITLFRRDGRERWMVYLGAMILLWVAVIMSRSRGGVLAVTVEMIGGAALFINLRRTAGTDRKTTSRNRLRSLLVFSFTSLALLIVLVVGMAWLGGDQLQTGIETATIEMGKAESNQGARRIDIWQASWRMARAHPIAGAGLGGFWAEFPLHHHASGAQAPKQAHNDYLELLASGGLVGAAIFVWFLVELVRRTRSQIAGFSGWQRGVALGSLVGMLGVAVHSLFDFGLHITVNALVMMMLLAILNLSPFDQRSEAQGHRNGAFNNRDAQGK